jgi:hypothetical protein
MRIGTVFGALAPLALGTLAFASVSPLHAAPPFWGATYAYTLGPEDPATFSGGQPVHVAALLPGDLACTSLADARLDDPGPKPWILDMLRAAPVRVTLEQSECPAPGETRWIKFTIPHPLQADILHLVYVTPGGKPLGSQKVSISGGAGGRLD